MADAMQTAVGGCCDDAPLEFLGARRRAGGEQERPAVLAAGRLSSGSGRGRLGFPWAWT
jgi:hypothetical protein